MFVKLLLIAVVLIGLSFIGLALNIIFKKNGRFPQTQVGHNKEMKKRGISCARCEELKRCKVKKI